MMGWLLILTMALDGQTIQRPVGIMADERLCTIAGAGMSGILERANPGLTVDWVCVQGTAA